MVNTRIETAVGMVPALHGAPVEWRVTDGLVGYPEAAAAMERQVAAIAAGEAAERVWLLEHPPLYTAGTSARPGAAARSPITGRGSASPM